MLDEFFTKDLLEIVAHDLKSPIGAIRGYIELIQKVGDLNTDQARYCERVMVGLERMEMLIAGVLDMARLEDGKLVVEDCDLGALVHSAVDLVENIAEKRAIALQIQVDDQLGIVSGDAQLLGQVVGNLLTNAIKYNRDEGEIFINVTNQPDFVRVDVVDTGLGIPQEDQAYIFDKFVRAGNSAQAMAAGSGLGLAIVKAIVQIHEGYVWFESVEGEGTTFSFTLPRTDQHSEDADDGREQPGDSGEGSEKRYRSHDEQSIEAVDDVDDNMQESRDSSEIDSSNDVV